MKTVVNIAGSRIQSEKDFHREISTALEFPDFYGNNLDALWDCLSGYIDTNICLVWTDHKRSKSALGDQFELIRKIFDELKEECSEFEYRLD